MHDFIFNGRTLNRSQIEFMQLFETFISEKAPITFLKMSGSSQSSNLPISSFPSIGTSPPSPYLKNIIDCSPSSTASCFSSPIGRTVIEEEPSMKPDMIFDNSQGAHMAAKLSAFFESKNITGTSIDATFARGKELDKLDKLVEIEEINEAVKNSFEVKFKKEEDDEEKEARSEVHIEMDVLLGILEEKKVSPSPTSVVLVGDDEVPHLQKSEVRQVKDNEYSEDTEEIQFVDWRRQIRQPHGNSDTSAKGDTCKRKKVALDESKQSTAIITKRAKIEGL